MFFLHKFLLYCILSILFYWAIQNGLLYKKKKQLKYSANNKYFTRYVKLFM